MKTHEYQVQIDLWVILKGPFLINCDVANISQDTKKIFMNSEVIVVKQVTILNYITGELGIQATRERRNVDMLSMNCLSC
ncbi:unnamed protein product [Paramecium octaurelia]|uniref:Uncharacterized protein n=1 Tax=Paramecium octaurelia TaxID=43137 RepID=A0A8S1TC25_PAROT|nr:unnamed protein product [Paramecium octaurelia]